jgi:hypothetical protein
MANRNVGSKFGRNRIGFLTTRRNGSLPSSICSCRDCRWIELQRHPATCAILAPPGISKLQHRPGGQTSAEHRPSRTCEALAVAESASVPDQLLAARRCVHLRRSAGACPYRAKSNCVKGRPVVAPALA